MNRFLVLLCLVLALISCKRPEAASSTQSNNPAEAPMGIQARLELDGEPRLGTVPLTVYVLNNGAGVTGAKIEITGDMTHTGMVPVIAEASESEAGLYRAEDFAFTMAGDWILTTELELSDGSKERIETRVTVPGN